MMVSGTYVLTDTIDRSFDQIFTQSNEGVDAVVTSKQNIETVRGRPAAIPRVGPAPGRRGRRGRGGRGLDRRPAGLDHRRRRRSARRQRRPRARLLGQRPVRGPVRPAHLRRGQPADVRRRGRDRQGVGRGRGLCGRRQGDDRRPRRDRRVHPERDRDARRRRLVRRRDDRGAHPARGPADHRQGGRVRPDLGRRRGRRLARPARRLAAGGAPPTSTSRPASRTSSPSATTSASSPASSRPRC